MVGGWVSTRRASGPGTLSPPRRYFRRHGAPKSSFRPLENRVVPISQRTRIDWAARRLASVALALAFGMGLAPRGAQAQASTVQGQIRDEEGTAVFGATVSLYRGDRRLYGADTDRLGSFRISEVLPGPYEMGVQALGYGELVDTLDVGFATTETLDLRLERSALRLEGIAVQAERSRQRRRFEEVPGPTVREMDRSEVRWVPGVAEPDPVRAIEVLPGVVSTSDFSAAFHVRGGSQDQNLILLDGIPIFSPFHLGGLFSVFNADMIDRVELMSGGFPAEHGGRVSSVLEIDSDPGSGDFGVDGGVSLLSSRAAVAGSLPKGIADALGHANVRYRLSARRSYFDVLLKPAFEFPYHLTDLQGVVEGWTRSGGRISVSAYSGKDVFDLTSIDNEDFPLRVDWDWGNDAVGARWTQPRNGGGSVDVRANFSRFGTGLVFPDFGDTEFDSRIRQAQLRTDFDFRPTSRWSFQTGAMAQRLSYDNSFVTGGTDFGGGSGTGNLLGSYVQARWSSPRRWLMEIGLRGDVYAPEPGATVFEPAPRIAVKRFVGSGDVALKVAAGRYTQFLHSLRDEELPLGIDIWVLAGARAPHTVSDQIQLGIEGFEDIDWYWSVEGYFRRFDGVVAFNPADDPNDALDDILGGEGTSWGVDLMLRKETGAVQGWIALSFLKAERTFPDALSPLEEKPRITYPPIFDRRLDADLVFRYPAPWGWTGGVRWNLGTGIPYTRALGSYAYYQPRYVDGGGLDWTGDDQDGTGGYGVVLGERNSSRYPTYHRLDLSFRRTFPKSWGSLTPYLNLVNLYNRRNALFYFYQYEQDPPVRSGISMFPVLPTIGLEVTF